MKLKRLYPGRYETSYKGFFVEVYQAESKRYWSSTITFSEYGKDDWKEEVFQGYTKKEVVGYIKVYIDGCKMKTAKRVRLIGSKEYTLEEVKCADCGCFIIENHKAEMPIFYTLEEEGRVYTYCPKCNPAY